MYLAGTSASIDVRSPSGDVHSFDSITVALDNALRTPGAVATNVFMEEFAGGWLANGCPLNVYFGQGWLPGQEAALRAAGKTACLPTAISPAFNVLQAPEYKQGGFTATGQRIVPGMGVQTASAPQIIASPLGPVADFNVPTPPVPQEAGMGNMEMIALAGLAIGLFGILRRK